MQVKLLRVLEEGEVWLVGGTHVIKIDVRFVAATNRKLEEALDAGTFRPDLFYRLNVITLTIPPLRERPEDIPLRGPLPGQGERHPEEPGPGSVAGCHGLPAQLRVAGQRPRVCEMRRVEIAPSSLWPLSRADLPAIFRLTAGGSDRPGDARPAAEAPEACRPANDRQGRTKECWIGSVATFT